MKNTFEDKFIDSIDCCFPYTNKTECLSLIAEAAKISPNCVFKVIEELCRIPTIDRQHITDQYLIELLQLTETKFAHPLKEMILDAAKKMILGVDLKVEEVIVKMEYVRQFSGQFSALSILYFSSDDKEQKLEPIWNSIIADWNNNGA